MSANRHVGPRDERPLELRLAHAQADDRELRGSERDQDAEGVEAREERRIPICDHLGEHDQSDRQCRGDPDRLAGHDRSPLEARELTR